MEIYIEENSEEESKIFGNYSFMNINYIKNEIESENFIGFVIIDNKIYSVFRKIKKKN